MTQTKLPPFPNFATVPSDELANIFRKLRAALELKYKIMDTLYPRVFNPYEKLNNTVNLSDIHRENAEKLQTIRRLVEEFEI